jgi:DNA-binding IclR family transcriptional regulator
VPHTLSITDEQAVHVANVLATELIEVSTGMSTYMPAQHRALANVLQSMNPENEALEMFDQYVDTLSEQEQEQEQKQAQRQNGFIGYGNEGPRNNK